MRLSFPLLSKQLCAIRWQEILFSSLNSKVCWNSVRSQSSESTSKIEKSLLLSHMLNCDINILNKDGRLEIHSGPFDRGAICEEYGVEPRDLQKIDPELLINVPIIDVRQRRFICFSFRRLRCLVQSNRGIFFVPSAEKVLSEPFGIKDSVHWERIAQEYQRNVRYIHHLYSERFIRHSESSSTNIDLIPFEFRITEINLEAVAFGLRNKTNELLNDFRNIRERAHNQITVSSLRELALLKEKVDKYKRNAELAHQSIIDVLAHDEDLIAMYLTDNRQRDLSDHIQAELLLEACAKQMAEVKRSISDLSDSAHTLESATGFMLDAVRNELIAFEIKINIITMGIGFGALIAGIYGMNLTNGFEQNPYAFYAIAGSTTCFITSIVAVAFFRLFRYGKIRLLRSYKNNYQ